MNLDDLNKLLSALFTLTLIVGIVCVTVFFVRGELRKEKERKAHERSTDTDRWMPGGPV